MATATMRYLLIPIDTGDHKFLAVIIISWLDVLILLMSFRVDDYETLSPAKPNHHHRLENSTSTYI